MISPEEARHIVSQNVYTPMFEVLRVRKLHLKTSEGHILSHRWHLEIHIRLQDLSEEKHVFFVKVIPPANKIPQQFVLSAQMYKHEKAFYEDIIPLLRKYTDESNNSEKDEKGRWAPHCYLVRNDIIVMQDLSVARFKHFNNRDVLDFKHCVAVLQELANFHAASIIFEEKESQMLGDKCYLGDTYLDVFQSILTKPMANNLNEGWFADGVKDVSCLMSQMPKYKHDPAMQRKIQENIPKVFMTIFSILRRSERFRNVVCHGDLWSKNFMFRYENDFSPSAVRFLDFQFLRYSPPASDITMFLYVNLDRCFREEFSDTLIREYFSQLESSLLKYEISVNDVLPFEDLKSSFDLMSAGGRVLAAIYLHVIMLTREKHYLLHSTEKFSDDFLSDCDDELCEWFINENFYQRRLGEEICELVEKDILKL